MHGGIKNAQPELKMGQLLKDDTLGGNDWKALAEVMEILQTFYDLTRRAERTKLSSGRGVLSDYITTFNELLNHVREPRDDYNIRAEDASLSTPPVQNLLNCVVECWTKLDQYFAKVNETPAHYASVVTTPHMKWKYFEHIWRDAVPWKDATDPECCYLVAKGASNPFRRSTKIR